MANTLKFGNGVWANKKGSTLAYNDDNGNFKPLPFTTTRSTGATRVNKEGLIEVVSNEVPRVDYTDSEDGVFLLEKASTNLITYSEDASQWININTTISKDYVISPDGTLNADKFEFTGNGSIRPNISQLTFTNDYSFSIFIKKGNSRYVTLAASFFSSSLVVGFDLDTETSQSGGIIENYGNDWYRLSLSNNVTGDADRTGVFYVYLPNSLGAESSVSGNNAYVWGAMAEESSFKSSYIPTQGAVATRSADTASGSGNSEVFNDSEGVLYAEISALANDGTTRRISISDGTTNNRIVFSYNPTTNQFQTFLANPIVQFNFLRPLSNAIEYNKIAVKYKQNDFALWINGVRVNTDITGTTPNGLNTLNFDEGSGASDFYGNVKDVRVYNNALTDAELQALTTI